MSKFEVLVLKALWFILVYRMPNFDDIDKLIIEIEEVIPPK